MAISAGDAYLDIGPRLASNFGRQLSSQVQAPISRAGEEASKHFGRSFARGVGTAAKGIGVGIAAGLGVAVVAARVLTPVLKQSVQGYRDHLKVVAQTTAVIRSTGGAAKVTVKHISALSDALERKTTVDGDVIQTGANMIATFTNVRNEVGKGNNIFDRATSTVLDMSVALGQDTKNSAIQLGKALNDPIAGVGALSRVGVTFTEQQKKQIKTLVESGNTLGAQKIILAELNKEFGGSAAASATASGRMQVAFHQLQDTIGSILLPVVDQFQEVLAFQLLPDLQMLATKYGPGIQRFLQSLVRGFGDALPSAKQLSLGLNALGAAFSGEGITTSGDSFVGKMERIGVGARKLVDALKQGRLGAKAFVAAFQGEGITSTGFVGGMERLGVAARQFVDSFKQAGPQLKSAGGGGQVFANSLIVIGPVLDVVARNIHNLVPWLPAIVAGFLAFRAIRNVTAPLVQVGELISNITAPFRIAALFGQKRALQAHTTALVENTAAMRGNAVSAELSTGATNAGVLASIRARVAAIGQAIAQKAIAVASKAWAAAQWLVNAALTANPIGIVIALIVGLAAGIVLAYKKSETFRRIVDTVFRAIKGAVGTAVNFIIGLLRGWLDVQFTVVAGILHVMGKLPGPMGAPFRKAEEAVRGAKKTVDEQLGKIQARVNRLTGKDIPITARTNVEVAKSVRQYLAAANVPGFRAKGGLTRLGETAIVGEEGPELVKFTRPAYVYTAAETRGILGRGLAAGGPVGWLEGRFYKPTVRQTGRIGQSMADVAAAVLGQAGGGGTGATGSVNQIAQMTARLLGRFNEWAAWARRIMFESGGNWSAVNRSDSNWRAGHPSVGGAQVIRGTFAANAGPYRNVGPFLYGVSINPLANSYAGGHYAIGRYGSLAAVDPRVRPMGYDLGGGLRPGATLALNSTGRTEPVGFDYDKMAEANVRAMKAAGLGATYLDGRRVDRGLGGARIANARLT